MRQELQQANETLAAREAELEEIKSRLAELEEIQSDQQQLISMKDNELASVQAELAQAREAAADSDLDAGAAGWWIGGGVLLALVLLGAWLLQRRADQVPRFRAPVAPATVPPPENSLSSAFSPAPAPKPAPKPAATEAFPSPAIAPAPGVEPEPGAEPGPGLESRAETGASGEPVAGAAALGSDDTEAPGNERLELARAFMQLGDVDSARQLLTELVVNGSLASRQEASRLLRELD